MAVQVLVQRLEEQLDQPTLLLMVRDGRCPKVQMIRDQYEFAPVFTIPDDDTAQMARTILLVAAGRKNNYFVG